MKYEDLRPISKADAEHSLHTCSAEETASCLIRVALHDPDQQWAERLLLRAIRDERVEVRAAAVTGLGHLARIHRNISNAAFESLQQLRDSPLSGLVEDALEEIVAFAKPTIED